MSIRRAERSERQRARAAPVFAALGDPCRLQLVARLSGGESLSIAQLTEGSRVTRQAVSKHLRVLAAVELVRSARSGREQLWALDPVTLDEAKRNLDAISSQWDAALARLQSFFESTQPPRKPTPPAKVRAPARSRRRGPVEEAREHRRFHQDRASTISATRRGSSITRPPTA